MVQNLAEAPDADNSPSTTAVEEIGAPLAQLALTAVSGEGAVFEVPEELFIGRLKGRDLSDLAAIEMETDSGGHLGLRSDGMLVYRSESGFTGSETFHLVFGESKGAAPEIEVAIEVVESFMDEGWGSGEHYVLARDADGWSIAEPGENHRVVHVSKTGSPTGDGFTPETAMTPKAYQALLATLDLDPTARRSPTDPASWHVLFERGHDYGRYSPGFADGEDALHPFVIGAYGEGARPVFQRPLRFWGESYNDVLVRDIEFSVSDSTKKKIKAMNGIDILYEGHSNLMFENVLISPYNSGVRVQSDSDDITFYRTTILDAHRETPGGKNETWNATIQNRISGIYVNHVDGLLVEGSLIDYNGWREGYNPEGGKSGVQPPSKYSHDLYVNSHSADVTLRDNIFSRAASFGVQLRPGGVVDGNLFFDNNAALAALAGANDTLILDSVIAHPASKVAPDIGAQGWGIGASGAGAVVETIVAHDGDGLGDGQRGVRNALNFNKGAEERYVVEDVTIFNWGREPDATPRLSQNDRDAAFDATLDLYAATALGNGADRLDLIELWRERDHDDWGAGPDAGDAVAFFRSAFGYAPLDAAPARTVIFEADPAAEGFRWDNRLNWSDDIAPQSGDRVLLDGHWVSYGPETLRLATLDLGEGGSLRVAQALVEVVEEGGLNAGRLGGRVETDNAGQFIFKGYDDADALSLSVFGGRAANTGVVSGALDVSVSGGQMLLGDGAARFELREGARLSIDGQGGLIGFDGVDAAVSELVLAGGELSFIFEEGGVSGISEIRSGRNGAAAPQVTSHASFESGVLTLDLSELSAVNYDRRFALVDVDKLLGGLGQIDVRMLGAFQGAHPTLVWDDAAAAIYLDIAASSF